MALGRASLVRAVALTTAGVTATDKTTALCAAIVAAVKKELAIGGVLTPQQQQHIAATDAEIAANIADFVTALVVE